MKTINSSARKALAGLFLSVTALTASMAQTSNVQDDLVGTWLVVSSTSVGPDGRRVDNFGGNPKGIMMLDRNGHFSLQQMGDARRKFASNNRLAGTADENKAAVQGSLAFFGTYSIDPAANVITFHLDRSSFPNWDGVDQQRPFTLVGDDLKWSVPSNTSGNSTGEVVFKRAK